MEVRVDANGREIDKQRFVTALSNRCKDLKLTPLAVREQDPFQTPSRGTLAVLFLDLAAPLDQAKRDKINLFLSGGGTLIPVAVRAKDVSAAIAGGPTEKVSEVNAFLQENYGAGNHWVEALVDEALTHLWMRRLRKRVFISYKRSDANGIARQLFDRFGRLGFQAFLDEASIAPADNFQLRLKWWLNDADLLILLASPNIDDSKWVFEEIQFALNHHVGILVVEWPTAIYDGQVGFAGDAPKIRDRPKRIVESVMPDQRRTMTVDFFEPANPNLGQVAGEQAQLTSAKLDEVVAWAIDQRAASISDRLSNLVVLTAAHLDGRGIPFDHDQLGDFTFSDGTLKHLLRVVPFRPDHSAYYDLARAAEGMGVAGCLYIEPVDVHDEVLALRWCLEASRARPGGPATDPQLTLKVWSHPGGVMP